MFQAEDHMLSGYNGSIFFLCLLISDSTQLIFIAFRSSFCNEENIRGKPLCLVKFVSKVSEINFTRLCKFMSCFTTLLTLHLRIWVKQNFTYNATHPCTSCEMCFTQALYELYTCFWIQPITAIYLFYETKNIYAGPELRKCCKAKFVSSN